VYEKSLYSGTWSLYGHGVTLPGTTINFSALLSDSYHPTKCTKSREWPVPATDVMEMCEVLQFLFFPAVRV